ncbi:apoptosis-antagonizing transcription factor [Biscogniauxia mediterranea]|nr:apoptosis-antagonizing transcription factor [Biscogniauxia mediterranea]
MGKPKGHARQFADWEERPAQDYDPEAEVPDESDSSASASEDEQAGTEHYVQVSESKLRRKGQGAPSLYPGARITRAALEAQSDEDTSEEEEEEEEEGEDGEEQISSDDEDVQEDFDDPETADLELDQKNQSDAEIDSDNAFDENDEKKFKDFVFRGSSQSKTKTGKRAKRATAADWMAPDDEDAESSDGAQLDDDEDSDEVDLSEDDEVNGFIDDEAEESDEEEGDGDGDEDEDEDEGEEGKESGSDNEDEDEEDDDENMEQPSGINGSDRATMKDMMNAGQRSVVNSLSTALQKDVAKGRAVRRQRKAFDALLNVRIRLQKSLVAVNSFSTVEESQDQLEPYEAAEAAAIKLWNAIDNFRAAIQTEPAKAGQKRKRVASSDTPSQDIWDRMEVVEQRAITRRKAVLQKWSHSARNMRTVDRSSRRFAASSEKPLTTMLDEELDAPDRLIKRTRTPRSCAPAQVAKKVNEDPNIFDDADFYQLLLKELVDQRTGDSSGAGAQAATIRYTAAKEAKAKRHVDTKASKGRKMRFNVHEKLQNFMAPEDRRSWEQSAIDRFFGALFGQKMVLHEDEDVSDEEMGGVPIEDDGLRLFRN